MKTLTNHRKKQQYIALSRSPSRNVQESQLADSPIGVAVSFYWWRK